MRAVIQRIASASVSARNITTRAIGRGMLILLGVERGDEAKDAQWLVKKIAAMRIFEDTEGKMNRSLLDMDGEALVVSQFTLIASTKKGNRPSFNRSAPPSEAVPLYELFVRLLSNAIGKDVPTGEFGEKMHVEIHNEGPVTIIIDSRNRI